MPDDQKYAVWCGIDVGKEAHHACALDENGDRLFDRPLPQDEASLKELFERLRTHGRVLVIVDQPNTIGSLSIAVAKASGVDVAYLPGLAMRKAAQLLPGDAKTDARDAYVIAITAQRIPDTLREVGRDDETMAELRVYAGRDDDLVGDATRSVNRLRAALLQIHPALERVFRGSKITNDLTLDLLIHYGGPSGLMRAGRVRVTAWAKKSGHRKVEPSICEVFDALAQQTVTVAGTAAAEAVIPQIAQSIKDTKHQRAQLNAQVEQLIADHPLYGVLVSMPGVGTKTAIAVLLAVGDASSFPSAGHLASYAGIAPTTWQSGKSIKGEHPSRAGNKQLKNALFRSAWVATLHDPASRAYYQRKRSEGKRHNAAVICLARRRCDVIWAMLRKRSLYQAELPSAA